MTSGAPSTPHEAIEVVVDADPDAVAAWDGDRPLTYREVDDTANGIAAALLGRVEVSDRRVVIAGGHDVHTAIAILGAMKSGATTVVVDEHDPTARRREICARVDPVATVAFGDRADDLGLDVPMIRPADTSPIRARPTVAIEPSDPVWIVFTSGTSGRPKGILATHGFVANPGNPETSVATSIVAGRLCWHGGLSSVVKGWTVGGTLVFHDLAAHGTTGLADLIDHHHVDRIFLVPTVTRSLVDGLEHGRRLESLRRLTFGGEAARWSDVAKVAPHLDPACVIRNTLGSSETRAISNYSVTIGDLRGDEQGPLPVGRALPRWRYRIVDQHGHDAERGRPGELLVSSPHLFDGYWNDPELTAERMWTEDDGARWFATRDLVAERDDGMFVYHGRADLQTKIAGVLVAPQEAEQLLADAPGVREAAVVAARGPGGRERLVAHLRVDDGAPDSDALLATLRDHLAPPLVPSEIRRSDDELPRLATGKVDRVALAERSERAVTGRGGEPRGEAEKVISATIADVLGTDVLGRDDDLWELGCDSLGAVELVERFEQTFGVAAPITTLLDAPTPATLAREFALPTDRSDDLTWLTAGDRLPLVVVPGVGDTALRFRRLAVELGGDQPVVVVEHAGSLRRSAPSRSVKDAAARAEQLLATVVDAPFVLLGHSYGALVAYECARRLERAGHPPPLVVVLDMPVDGRQPPSKATDHWQEFDAGDAAAWFRRGAAGLGRRTWRTARRPVDLALAGRDRPGTIRHHERLYVVGARATKAYRPGPYAGKVLLVRSDQRPDDDDPSMGWRSIAPNTDVVAAPGRHDLLPMRAEVADLVRAALAEHG